MVSALGCRHPVAERVGTHLFGIAPNNSGSTFLQAAMAASRATWNLDREGQMMLGYVGPNILWPHPAAHSPEASVFYTKPPSHLLVVDELASHFHNAKFLFMVRNMERAAGSGGTGGTA